MKNIKDNKKIVFGIGIAFLFLATIGFSYAYFTATLVNKDVKDQVVETGTLSLKYTDGTAINGVNISPGWTATKTVTIENTGTLDAFYTIFWKDLVNEITNDELVMSLECESSTDTCATINFENQTVPSSKNAISENIIIYPGEVQTITLNFEFQELNKAQDYNQGKKFNGVINIEDSTKIAFQTEYTMYTRVVDQNDNPIANMTVELHSDVKSGITDENGYVRISGIVPGKHELYVKDSNGNTLDTKNIEITQKKESDITNDSTIYIDSSLTEFTNTIKLTNDNKLDSIENLIVPPDECFYVSGSTIGEYYSDGIKCPYELKIPSSINGTIITSLVGGQCGCSCYRMAFRSKKIKKVIIPDSIENISNFTFENNNLTNIDIPKSVKNIGNSAFNNNQLVDSQAIIYARNEDGSEDKTTIVSYGGKNKEVKIPDSVTSIGGYAFSNNNLTSVTIPDSVTTIEYDAFSNNNLTSVTIPNGVTSIGSNAFSNNKLTSVTIPESVTSIGYSALQNNNLTSVTIPESVTSIGYSALQNNNLTSVTIPNSVTTIGSNAFQNNNLTSVTIPNGVTTIGSNTFSNNKLTSVTIPNSVTTIEWGAFSNNNLTSVTIPNGVTSIGESAFSNNNLTSVTILNSVKKIGGYAFSNNNLTSVTIPDSVTTIEYEAFSNNNLTSVTIPESVTSIGSSAFENNKLTSVTIPNGVTSIGYSAFNDNELPDSQAFIYKRNTDGSEDKTIIVSYGGKNKNVIIPNAVTAIEEYAFRNNKLTSITIPDGVTSISYNAFSNNNLKSVTIPSSVTRIYSSAFSSNNLTSVTIKGKTSSSEFTTYSPSWGWASNISCTKDNTSNVTNGCITWGAN